MDIDNGAANAAPDAGTVDTATPSNEPNTTTNSSDPWSAIDATMDQAYDRVNPSREANGQFKGDDKTAPAEGGTPDAKPVTTEANPTAPIAEPPPAAISAPQSLPAELKALWEKAPPELKPLLEWKATREAESHKRISELGQTVKAYEPIRNVIDHYKADFQARNIDPARGFASLMEVQRMLDSDFVSGINEIARVYGKPSPFASSPAEGDSNESSQQVRSLETKIANLEKQLGQTREHVMADIRSKQEQEMANLTALVDEFSKEKTEFAEIESDVVAQIHAIRSAEPGLDSKTLLARAYEAAQWANPKTRAKLQEAARKADEDKRAEEAKKKAEDAKKAARLNVKSSSNTVSRRGSWEDTMDSFRQ